MNAAGVSIARAVGPLAHRLSSNRGPGLAERTDAIESDPKELKHNYKDRVPPAVKNIPLRNHPENFN